MPIFLKMLEALNVLGRERVERMVGSLPIPMVCLQSATPREGSSLLDAEVRRAVSHRLPFRQKAGCQQLHI